MHVKIKRQGGVLSGEREVKEKLYESLSSEKWPAAYEYCRVWPAWLLLVKQVTKRKCQSTNQTNIPWEHLLKCQHFRK